MAGPTMGAIPRPPDARPGGPPVWEGLDRRQRAVSVAQVEAALAAYPTAPDLRPPGRAGDAPPLKASATLCPLFDDGAGLACVLLTVRSSRMRNHRGEISFPGGRMEPGETVEQAATREAWEETGLPPDAVRVVGRLPGLWTYVSHSRIHPTVGVLRALPPLVANPAEVEEIFTVPLATLVADDVYHQELWNLPDLESREMHFFSLPHGVVWGATARMLYELCRVICRAVRDGAV